MDSGGIQVTQEGNARIYLFENQRFPSVTTVIDEFFPFWRGSNQDEAQAAAMLGTEVHGMCAELTQHRRFAPMRIDSYSPQLVGYGYSWLKFMEAMNAEVVSQEKALFSKRYKIAGRPDAIMLLGRKRKPTVVDYTIGSTRIAKRLQTAAYSLMWKEMMKDRHKFDRIEVPLKKDGSLPTLRVHDNDNDKYAFLNAVNLYRWKDAA